MATKALIAAGRLPVPVELAERRILIIRGQKVMLDNDLAELYQVETRILNQAVRRNRARFPADFMFPLTRKEAEFLRSQSVISKTGRGGRRYLPLAFTEHGVAMLASVLHSDRAVQMSIVIIRAFVRLRELLASYKDFARKIEQIEATQRQHASIIVAVADEIRKLKRGPGSNKRKMPIGFVSASANR